MYLPLGTHRMYVYMQENSLLHSIYIYMNSYGLNSCAYICISQSFYGFHVPAATTISGFALFSHSSILH